MIRFSLYSEHSITHGAWRIGRHSTYQPLSFIFPRTPEMAQQMALKRAWSSTGFWKKDIALSSRACSQISASSLAEITMVCIRGFYMLPVSAGDWNRLNQAFEYQWGCRSFPYLNPSHPHYSPKPCPNIPAEHPHWEGRPQSHFICFAKPQTSIKESDYHARP